MNKKILIAGSIIIVLAIISMVALNFTNLLASTELDTGEQGLSGENPGSWTLIFPQSYTTNITGFYSNINVQILFGDNAIEQQYNISIGLKLLGDPQPTLAGCTDGRPSGFICIAGSTIVSAKFNETRSVQAFERRINIPILTSGFGIPSDTAREYYVKVTGLDSNSFTYLYRATSQARIGLFVDIPLFVIGLVVIAISFALTDGSSKGRPMKSRSWQEPTLGGGSGSSSKGSFKSSKGNSMGSSGGNTQSKRVSTSVNCKKCGGVMPRNSQYCPHCYTKQ